MRPTRTMIAALVGFACLMPGVSVATIGGLGLQPVLPLLVLHWIFSPPLALKIPVQPMLWAFLNIVAVCAAAALSSAVASVGFAILHGVLFTAAGLGLGTLLAVPADRRAFLDGYLASALVSSVLGIAQAVVTQIIGVPLLLVNSANFALESGIGRAAAFTPEASVLAGLLLPALCCVWFERGSPSSVVSPPFRSLGALLLIGAGLLATRSSSLLVAPAALAAAAFFLEPSWRKFVGTMGRLLMIVGVAGLAFLPLYQGRVGDNDEAGWSRAWRGLKMETGLRIFTEEPLLGAGPGYVSDVSRFSRRLRIPPQMAWMSKEPQKGIDSTPVRILAETGLVGFLLTYYPLLAFWQKARALARRADFRPLYSMCPPLLLAQVVALGYRDLIMLLLPCVVFALAADARLGERRRIPAAGSDPQAGGVPAA